MKVDGKPLTIAALLDLAPAPRPTLSAYYWLLFGVGFLKAYLKRTNGSKPATPLRTFFLAAETTPRNDAGQPP